MRIILPPAKKPKPSIGEMHSRSEIPPLDIDDDGEIDLPVTPINRRDPQLLDALAKLVRLAGLDDASDAATAVTAAAGIFAELQGRLSARMGYICASAAVVMAVHRLSGVPRDLRDYLKKELRRAAEEIQPETKGGRPAWGTLSDADRQLLQAMRADQGESFATTLAPKSKAKAIKARFHKQQGDVLGKRPSTVAKQRQRLFRKVVARKKARKAAIK